MTDARGERVTIQVDRYREPYARRPVDRPRQCVFAGNTNHSEYFKDTTGNRRFWPVRCSASIDLDKLAEWRVQLAENAVVTASTELATARDALADERDASNAAAH